MSVLWRRKDDNQEIHADIWETEHPVGLGVLVPVVKFSSWDP